MTLAEGGKSHPVPPPADPEAPPWDLAVELFFGAQEMPEEDLPIRPGKDGRETESSRATSPVPPTAPPESEGLLFGKRKLELRVTELTRQFGEASARASSLHYRLWQSLEAQKVLEMNLSGERANARMLEQMVEDLKNEIHRLKQQAGADFGSAQGPSEPGCHGGVVP